MLYIYVLLFSICLLQGANGEEVILNVVEFLMQLWKNLYTRLGETWKCFLDVMPTYLGGNDNACVNLSKT
ncbi:unnamed protein product [Schistosoma turkestanicum]|nr:unnamed protein product [Schistosoma turkestanicum]